jgi:hypothetical protein
MSFRLLTKECISERNGKHVTEPFNRACNFLHECRTDPIQIADRFHVLQNLKDVLDHVFTLHEQTLDTVNATLRPQPVPLSDGALAVAVLHIPHPFPPF